MQVYASLFSLFKQCVDRQRLFCFEDAHTCNFCIFSPYTVLQLYNEFSVFNVALKLNR